MSSIAPKPIIAQVVRTWRVPPGMTFAVVKDMEDQVWIVESCPAGTHFWTVAQAEELPRGRRTRLALEQAVLTGQKLLAEMAPTRGQEVVTASKPKRPSRRQPVEAAPASILPRAKSVRSVAKAPSTVLV